MISAFVSLFNPSVKNIENICSVAKQVDRVFVCDNSSIDNTKMFEGCPETVIYFPNHKNLGLSKAFNKVLKADSYWNTEEENWIIFFDQDSIIKEGHIEKLIKEFRNIKKKGIAVGCLGPVYYDTSSRKVEIPKVRHQISRYSYIVSSIITSSMLTTYETLREINFWNEDLFLDMADWDLCWRMQQNGKKVCLTKVITLHHSLGLGRKKIGLISLKVTNPIREYYQIRDCLYLKKEKYVPVKYKIRFLLMISLRCYLHVKYLDHGDQRKMYIERAKADYKKGIRGEFVSG